ncbi:MAG: radical SAM protein [Bacteriovoracaceae bacterium]|jgi:radical SAM protein with 4Fe4S-binding SPASM domain|nr:hypothetical protein [Halobacteriovoraceae bacterium]MDP7321985.1 radical SAM protein [Bacteriovoracaceae bacterium]
MLMIYKAKYLARLFFYYNQVGSILVDRLFFKKKFPLLLHIRITTKCNLSCPFCYLKEGLNQNEENLLTILEWKKILSNIPRTTIIDITGAEPMMAKDIDQFISLLSERGFKFSLTTNGTVYNSYLISQLVDSSLKYLMVSLDGFESMHNSFRGESKNAFKKTIKFLNEFNKQKNLKNKKIHLNIKIMLLEKNIDEIVPLIKYLEETIEPNSITINLPFKNEARGGLKLSQSLEEKNLLSGNNFVFKGLKNMEQKLIKLKRDLRQISTPVAIKPYTSWNDIIGYFTNNKKIKSNGCSLYKNNLTLYYNGDVTPCDISYKLKNIRELDYNLSSLYTKKRFKIFKQYMKASDKKICEGCIQSSQSIKKDFNSGTTSRID